MKTRRFLDLSYLLLIVMMFAASCEDPNSTSPNSTTDSTAIKDSLYRADSLWRLDSIRIVDSVRASDSLHVADSLHRVDSLATLLRPLPGTLVYAVYLNGKDTTYHKLYSNGLLTTYDTDHGLRIKHPDLTIDFTGGPATLGAKSIRLTRGQTIYWGHLTTSILVKLDTINSRASGTYAARLISAFKDTLTMEGSFEDLELQGFGPENSTGILGTDDYYGASRVKFIPSNVLLFNASYAKHWTGCRPNSSALYLYLFDMEIPAPQVGLFVNGQAKWSERVSSTNNNDRRCSNSVMTLSSTPQDSLMITEYDPAARIMKGWFTLEGQHKGDFQVAW